MNFSARKTALEARRAALSEPARQSEPLDGELLLPVRSAVASNPSTLGYHETDEVRQIDAALARLVEGSYGYCQICGEEIDAELLDLAPSIPFCRGCAE